VPQPAKDAAGAIFYAIRSNFSSGPGGSLSIGEVYRVQVDSIGNVSAVAQPTGIGWLRAYPSWDHTLVARVNGTTAGDEVYIMNPTTGEVVPLSTSTGMFGRFLGWHPNNREILYLVEGGEPETGLWLINFETGEYTIVVLQNPLYIRDAGMSPDGQRLVYSYQKGFEPGEMWLVNADGSDPKLLFDTGGAMFGLTWSPDGNRIAFVDQSQGLMVMNPDGTDRKVIARNFVIGHLFKPVWSPDSRYLAYVAAEPALVPPDIIQQGKAREVQDWDREAFLGSNIHIIEIARGQERPLVSINPTGQIEGNIDPAWSPDGKMIAFAALRNGQAGLWAINVDGTGLRQLAKASDLIRFPVWTQ
jgi:Tol biopolymer transport system component